MQTNQHPRPEVGRKIIKVVVLRKPRGILNPAIISLVLISYIITNQSMMSIMSSGKRLTNSQGIQSESGIIIVGLVSANPSPEPSPASGRSVTSGVYRAPPINGSIFGKRSVNSPSQAKTSQTQSSTTHNYAGSDSPRLDSQQQHRRYESSSSISVNNNNHNYPTQRSQTAFDIKSEARNYKDIITETIENFLALNNESDPEETSVAFCRMIVYECEQMLSTRRKSLARRKRKRTQVITIP